MISAMPTKKDVYKRQGIISGITMVFVPSLTAFAIPDILGGGKVMLIGNIIEQEFSTSIDVYKRQPQRHGFIGWIFRLTESISPRQSPWS